LAFMASITAAAKKGIIIKGANYLEGFNKVKAIVFDKTGTLTKGKPKVHDVMVFDNYPENDFLATICGLMEESNHPIAKAICRFAEEKEIKFLDIDEVHEEPGFGVKGKINNKEVLAGSVKFLEDNGLNFSHNQIALFTNNKTLGQSLVIMALDKKPLGFVSLTDSVRKEAPHIIDKLKEMGIEKIFMLTGDNEKAASLVAQEAHIESFRAGFLPEDKVNFLKTFLNKNYKTAMLGDGVNDAAALAAADIGLAMGSIGSDVALEAADIVLMKDNLHNIIDLFGLSRATLKVVN